MRSPIVDSIAQMLQSEKQKREEEEHRQKKEALIAYLLSNAEDCGNKGLNYVRSDGYLIWVTVRAETFSNGVKITRSEMTEFLTELGFMVEEESAYMLMNPEQQTDLMKQMLQTYESANTSRLAALQEEAEQLANVIKEKLTKSDFEMNIEKMNVTVRFPVMKESEEREGMVQKLVAENFDNRIELSFFSFQGETDSVTVYFKNIEGGGA